MWKKNLKVFYLNLKHKFKKPPVLHRHILHIVHASFLHSRGSVCLAIMGKLVSAYGRLMASGGPLLHLPLPHSYRETEHPRIGSYICKRKKLKTCLKL